MNDSVSPYWVEWRIPSWLTQPLGAGWTLSICQPWFWSPLSEDSARLSGNKSWGWVCKVGRIDRCWWSPHAHSWLQVQIAASLREGYWVLSWKENQQRDRFHNSAAPIRGHESAEDAQDGDDPSANIQSQWIQYRRIWHWISLLFRVAFVFTLNEPLTAISTESAPFFVASHP